LAAKEVRLTLESRKVPARFFVVDTGDPKQPITTPSLKMKPRSSFGVRVQGDFGEVKEFLGATITAGNEEFRLIPITSFDFENRTFLICCLYFHLVVNFPLFKLFLIHRERRSIIRNFNKCCTNASENIL
jgi:hypothetical protein